MQKEWKISDSSDLSIKEKLLKIRGITPEAESSFFQSNIAQLADPFLFMDMQKALGRIKKANENKERIIVFGDYDVDGVTGTAILIRTLLKLKANVSYRLPHRVHDGYGLKKHLVDEMLDKGVTLLITVDNGIASAPEISYAKEKGMDTIITDHHTIPSILPDAYAIIHPKREGESYPFKDLSGSGVAFMFVRALLATFLGEEGISFWENMIDIAMLGTIADCVPLLGENRVITKVGLDQLPNTNHQGLQFLMAVAGVEKDTISTHTIEYVLGPRINAGGRMDTALEALHLFLFSDEKSQQVAQRLHALNLKRQSETEKIYKEAEQKLQHVSTHNIIVIEGDWHLGVIGIVASRLAEKYRVPVFILGKKGDNYVASCRSEGYTNVVRILQKYASYFLHYGGHEGAAGFEITAEKYAEFQKIILGEYASQSQEPIVPVIPIDAVLQAEDITWKLFDLVSSFAPFGQNNEKPLFALEGVSIRSKNTVGKDKKHLKLLLEKNGMIFESIGFGLAEEYEGISAGEKIDVAFELEKNEFNGMRKINLIVKDIRNVTRENSFKYGL